MKEIEYKFLVDENLWKAVPKGKPSMIVQGFLCNSKEITVRVRIKNNQGFLTIKGETIGVTRSEFEYEIPLNEAEEIMEQFVEKQIIKKRYEIVIGEYLWEVDVFYGKLSGLILAEIELESEDESFIKPNWVTKDVSHDPNYYNALLIEKG